MSCTKHYNISIISAQTKYPKSEQIPPQLLVLEFWCLTNIQFGHYCEYFDTYECFPILVIIIISCRLVHIYLYMCVYLYIRVYYSEDYSIMFVCKVLVVLYIDMMIICYKCVIKHTYYIYIYIFI